MNFSLPFMSCGKKAQDGFYLAEGYLFKESLEGGLIGHFGIDKTLVLLKETFYRLHMKKDVHNRCPR